MNRSVAESNPTERELKDYNQLKRVLYFLRRRVKSHGAGIESCFSKTFRIVIKVAESNPTERELKE